MGRRNREILPALAAAGVVLFLTWEVALRPFTVASGSMLPTLLPSDSILVNRLCYWLHPPYRGDLVVFSFPQADGRVFVKRVIGLPGDVVEEQDGQFYVNGKLLAQEDMLRASSGPEAPLSMTPHRIPPGRLFVLGDNRTASLDSRYWGTVAIQNVIGKAILVYWSRGKDWWDVRWNRIGHWLR